MYGMVNQGIKNLVVSNFGQEKWDEICQEAQAEHKDFEMLKTYSDSSTYDFVGAASKVLGVPAEGVLKLYGKYWISFAASHGYEDMLAMFGPDLKTCLINLNHMHSHMGSFMPDIRAPQFNVTVKSEKVLEVVYVSERVGLLPFVEGLFEGLAERYNTKIQLNTIGPKNNGTLFEVIFL